MRLTTEDTEVTESITPKTNAFTQLLESLDEWIEDALKNSKPIGLTLSRARITIINQYDRIGEFLAALEQVTQERNKAKEELKEWQTLRLYGADPEHIHAYIKRLRYEEVGNE